MKSKTSARIVKPLLVAWLCVLAVLDLRTLPGMVLCFGEDGHVDLESAADDKCQGGAAAVGEEPAWVESHVEHCGECLDLPLSSEMDPAARGMILSGPAVVPPAALVSSIHLPAPAPATRRFASPPPRDPLELASIRSVRLLV